MQILDGRMVANKILEKSAARVKSLQERGVHPKLVVILVGNDPASQVYVKHKEKACAKSGVISEKLTYTSDEITTESLLAKINELDSDPSVHGILVQLPLPSHIETPKIIKAIDHHKDVDGFNAYNVGKMVISSDYEHLAPCTPHGVIRLFEYYNIDVKGKEAVVVGSSNIVGKPMANMLLNRKATVTVCHSKTQDLAFHTKRADILVVAVGRPDLITADMVKDGVVVVDVGMNRLDDGRLVGDVDFENIKDKASYITPVPGGVGPMTIACLIENVLTAAERLNS